jgi:hypothetical protein
MNNPAFTGSYSQDDVQFLLTPMQLESTPVHVKEALIQSGKKHYSEMLSQESLPCHDYVQLFYQALANNKQRLSEHVCLLARSIIATRPHGITLVSLARAGTPIGVLLKHVLQQYYAIDAKHYSVSIIRDIGLDSHALRYILQQHKPESLVFVDGWTGKGVIAKQLRESLQMFAESDGVLIPAELYVLADLSGSAAISASNEDYLIPSCILNATVSGLVSRSVYTPSLKESADFHGCVYYEQFAEHDLSNYFVHEILTTIQQNWAYFRDLPNNAKQIDPAILQENSLKLLAALADEFNISHANYIKPGIGEATRVLLRREAKLLLLQNRDCEHTQHLLWLAETKAIPVILKPDLPYRAVALIKEITT